MLGYPVKLKLDKGHGGYVVSLPDIPEAITQGETWEEALAMAAEALETAMDFYFEGKRVLPMPSLPRRGQRVVELPASVSAKVLLLNEMLAQKVRPAELARRMKTTPQEVNRLMKLHHSTKIDGIAGALKLWGSRWRFGRFRSLKGLGGVLGEGYSCPSAQTPPWKSGGQYRRK